MSISRPLVRYYGYQTASDQLVFLAESEHIEVCCNVAETQAVLARCTGHSTVDEIISDLQGEVTEVDVRLIIRRLFRAGVLLDSACLFHAFHDISANPPVYPHEISQKTIKYLMKKEEVRFHPSLKTIKLQDDDSEFLGLLQRRKSERNFNGTAITCQHVSGLLKATIGRLGMRSSPSGGALYPMTLMIAILVDTPTLKRGLYEYYRKEGELGIVTNYLDNEELQAVLGDDQLVDKCSAVLFVAADMERVARKYSNRSYRLLLLEAGHMAQNAYLYAAEQKLGIVEYGGYSDRATTEFLGLNYPKQAVLTVLIVGTPAGSFNSSKKVMTQDLEHTLLSPSGPVQEVDVGNVNIGSYRFPLYVGFAEYRVPIKTGRVWKGNAFSSGTSREIALLKVLAEAWERYVADSMLGVRLKKARAVDLREHSWVNPYDIHPISKEQQDMFNQSLSAFSPETKWEWCVGKQSIGGRSVLVPADVVYFERGIKTRLNRLPCVWASSSGVAAHCESDIAAENATLELIERDSLMTLWYGMRTVSAIPKDYLYQILGKRIRYWDSGGKMVRVLDITTDTVPVVLVLIFQPQGNPVLSSGSSAGITYEEAIRKAFTEAELMAISWRKRRNFIQEPKDVMSVEDHALFYNNRAQVRNLEWLLEAQEADIPPVRILEQSIVQTVNPVIVDLTPNHSKVGLKVIRAIAPQLMPINFGYATEPYGHKRLEMLGLRWMRGFPSSPHFIA